MIYGLWMPPDCAPRDMQGVQAFCFVCKDTNWWLCECCTASRLRRQTLNEHCIVAGRARMVNPTPGTPTQPAAGRTPQRRPLPAAPPGAGAHTPALPEARATRRLCGAAGTLSLAAAALAACLRD